MRAPIPEPKPGDLIEIFRPLYKHWAIYVGDGYVIHLAPQVRDAVAVTSIVGVVGLAAIGLMGAMFSRNKKQKQ